MTRFDLNARADEEKAKEVQDTVQNGGQNAVNPLANEYNQMWNGGSGNSTVLNFGNAIPQKQTADGETVVDMELGRIRPFRGKKGRKQPFKVTKEKVAQIKASAKDIGIITPIIVRPWKDENGTDCYQILSGHSRFKVAQELDLATIPTIVRDVADDEVEKYVVEANIQRVKLVPTEYGHIFERYMEMRNDMDLTANEIAEKFGVSPKSLYRYVNVLKCTNNIQNLFDDDRINIDCVDVMSGLPKERQDEIAENIDTVFKGNIKLSALKKYLEEQTEDTDEDTDVDGTEDTEPAETSENAEIESESGEDTVSGDTFTVTAYTDERYNDYGRRYGFTPDDISEEELDDVVNKALAEYLASKGYTE